MRSMYEGIAIQSNSCTSVIPDNDMTRSRIYSMVSASANPPSNGPTSAGLAGGLLSASSSSDIQPSEIFGVLSVDW